MPVTASELQPECNVDDLALRGAPPALDGWAAAPPMTESERLALARSSCAHPNAHMRAYIARALTDASPALLGDGELCGALDRLVADPIDDVRAAAEWWAVRRG